MNLRNKLLLSFLIFITALVALGVWRALSPRELGAVSRRIIAHNYDSVVAAQDMKESLERMDSSALFARKSSRRPRPWRSGPPRSITSQTCQQRSSPMN
jgi:hypothetical protein